MQITICTIGFTGKTAEDFFRLIEQAGVRKLIDIRESRIGQLAGYAKHPDLEFFLQRIAGIGYAHAPELAPSREIRKAYQATKDWPAYEKSFLTLMRERGVPKSQPPEKFGKNFALLCSEPGPEKCHRRLVADLLAGHWSAMGHAVEIKHLVIDKSRKKSGRRKKRGADGTHPE